MEVASSVAVGSTFSFEIPLEPAMGNGNPGNRGHDTALQTKNPVEQHGPPLDGLRALVVDDCEINREVVRRILETHGAIVTCCPDGAAAVEHVRAHHQHLDVVLIDVHMPILDGNEATRRIRSELGIKTLPIIGLTGSALLSEQQRSFDAGMNDVISKPFDPGTFLGKVRLLVDQSPACHRGFLD
jgi:CheY-like chemotaxis protein